MSTIREHRRATGPSPHPRGLDRVLLAGLLLVGVALPAIVSLLAGATEIPRLDDWVYRRVALELAQTGVLALHGVTTMMVGQIVVAQPFLWLSGFHSWGFTVAGVVFAAAGVVCTYALARQFLSPLRAAMATSTLLLFPAYLAYATSFMTDVPAIAAQFACLAFGVIALRRRPVWNRWLLASAAVGCFAFSFREFAIAAPMSVVLGAILAEPRRLRLWALAFAVVAIAGSLFLLKGTLSSQEISGGGGVGSGSWATSTYALSTVSLVMLVPAIVGGARWRRHWKRRDLVIGAELGIVVVAIRAVQWFNDGAMPSILMGSHASPWGAPTNTHAIGGRPLLFGDVLWSIVGLTALVATVVVLSVATGIVGAYLRRGDRSRTTLLGRLGSPLGLLALFSTALVIGLTLYGMRYPLFDRYYWPLVPVASILFMHGPSVSSSPGQGVSPRLAIAAPTAAVLSLMTMLAVGYVLNSFAFDSARWRAGDRLVELGIRPEEVDGGYDWVGFHQPLLPRAPEVAGTQTFYEKMWPGRIQCGMVSSDSTPPQEGVLVAESRYSLFLVTGPEKVLYLYRVIGADCPSR